MDRRVRVRPSLHDAEIQARFHGNFEAALKQTRSALGGKADKAAFAAASQRRAAELRAAAARHGLMKDPALAEKEESRGGKSAGFLRSGGAISRANTWQRFKIRL